MPPTVSTEPAALAIVDGPLRLSFRGTETGTCSGSGFCRTQQGLPQQLPTRVPQQHSGGWLRPARMLDCELAVA